MKITNLLSRSITAMLVTSSLLLSPASLLAQARPGVDSSGVQILLGNPQLNCSLPAMETICREMRERTAAGSGSLGNRIGTFYVGVNRTGYVWARNCFLAQASSNDNRNSNVVVPIAGPGANGEFLWQIRQGGVEDAAGMNCYFTGQAGTFRMNAFDNHGNSNDTITSERVINSESSGDNCTGINTLYTVEQTRSQGMLDALTGEYRVFGQYTTRHQSWGYTPPDGSCSFSGA